jgi:hypothetical protein
MRSLVLAVTLFSGPVGCSRGPDLTTDPTLTAPSSSTQALLSTPSSLTLDKSQNVGICPYQWTCDGIHYFKAQPDCTSFCAPRLCQQEFNCHGRCVCP